MKIQNNTKFRFTLENWMAGKIISSAIIFFSISFLPIFSESQKPTIAVLNFKSDGSLQDSQLQSISELVSSGLKNQDRYTVLDRGSSKERLKEIADQQLGLYDEIKTANASRSLGAEKILIGSVTKFGKNFIITAKIIDIGSGKLDSQHKETIESLDGMTDGVDALLKKFSRQSVVVTKKGMLWRSAILPGWGQLHSGVSVDNRKEKIKGLSFMGAAIVLGVGVFATDSAYKTAKSDYQSKSTIDTLMFISSTNSFNPLGLITYSLANSASGKMDSAANSASIASVLFVGLYAINLLDVIIFGGHDAVANGFLNLNQYSKTDGFKFDFNSNLTNGNLNREMTFKYNYNF